MDYAERGTLEKTLDRLIENEEGIAQGVGPDDVELFDDGEFTPEGRVYLTGLLSGILATVRTFAEADATFDDEDIDEIRRIAEGREQELLTAFSDGGDQ